MKYKNPTTGEIIEVGSPEFNPDLIKNLIPVSDTASLTVNDKSNIITPSSLTPGQSIDFTSPNQIPVYPVSGLDIPPLTMTQPEKEAQESTTQLQQLMGQLIGESTYRAEQEKTRGIEELTKTQTDLSARLKAIQNEALQIPLQLQQEAESRGITVGGLQPLQTARLRTNAIQALGVASLLEASRGNLTLAQDLVDRAVAQKFDPIKEEIATTQTNLNLILQSPAYTLADKNRAQTQKDAQDAKAVAIAKQEANQKEIYNISTTAAQYGAPANVLQQLQMARSPQEALQIAGYYLGAEFRQNVEDKQFQQTLQEAQYNLSFAKFEEDKRQWGIEYALQQQQIADEKLKEQQKLNPVGTAEASAEVLQGKIDLINSLIDHTGLDSRVGVGWTTRGLFAIADRFGAGQDFAAGVTQLVNKETIDTLVNLKARGGTLGALSDQERILLQSAATKIGTWEIKKDGIGIGKYNIDEKSFKAELKKIRDLAIKAMARALGEAPLIFTPLSTEEDDLRMAGYSPEQIKLLLELE